MNALSWKVLQEVRLGLLITKPNVRWNGVRRRRRRRCLGTKWVPRWSGFMFRCHDTTNVRNKERGREKERQLEKHQTRYNITNIETGRYVCMKMHKHMTCKFKRIMGSAQSKPTSTQHSNKVNTHLKCMKHCYNAHVMQCMKFQTSIWQNPSQKLSKNFIDFEKS